MRIQLASILVGVLAFSEIACSSSGNGPGGAGGTGGSSTVSTTSQTGATSGTTGTTTSTHASTSGTGSQNTSATTTSTGSGDPYAAARAACMTKINALRASKGLSPYGEWSSAETCVDQQATSDEMAGSPHQAWINGTYPSCNGNGQNECLGQGPGGIASCLDQMWNEKNLPGCSGCDACADAYDPNCANCDFYGTQTGAECGHYVNLSAKYFSQAACGFSSLGGWDAINFH